MQLVTKQDLMFGRRGIMARTGASVLMRLLAVDRINRLYAKARAAEQTPAAAGILSALEVTCTVDARDMKNIPASGACIVVANHPTGALDGIVLIDLLSKVRPDVKFMGNFLLDRIDFLRQYFIAVDPFDGAPAAGNVRGLKACASHLAGGGMLVIFPAGEVATWHKGLRVRDKAWSRSIMRFIRGAAVPVIPVCIEAANSLLFHVAGKVHPMLRTAMLPRELVNKQGKSVTVNIGSAITTRRTEALTDMEVWSGYVRANVEFLCAKRRRKLRIIPRRKQSFMMEEVAAPLDRELLLSEIEAVRAHRLLFVYGDYDIFFAPAAEIPNMMHEIGRLREVTFRGIGEGSGKSIDTDRYDAYYNQLFIWDRVGGALVGAYRMGLGGEIAPRYGLDGFYSHSLFCYTKAMLPILEKTIELGRSFITAPYQRKAVSLMLLWKGILYVLLKHDHYRNLLGPVTMSGEFQTRSKVILTEYLRRHHTDPALTKMVNPVTGLDGVKATIDYSLIGKIEDIELVNKIITDIERDEFSIPVLIRKYLQLNSRVLGFNVDHEFSDALDALMLLDLKRIPENIITMLSKEITDIDVIARFRQYH